MCAPKENTSTQKQEELNTYRSGVRTLFEIKSSKLISNGMPEHAAILFEEFFKNATKCVRIFSRKLDKTVFDSETLVKAAKAAIGKGINIDVLIQENKADESGFSKLLEEKKIPIKNVKQELSDFESNFIVMDDYAFRFEPDRTKFKATACMNMPSTATMLIKLFKSLQTC